MKSPSRFPHDSPHQRPLAFTLKALPAALALVFSQAGAAADIAGAAGLPQNGSVFSGSATGSVAGNQLTINQTTNRAVLDWTSFNIDAGKAVQFVQPGVASATLNRVNGDANPSQILGSLSANGTVMLMNPNGVMFGANSVVNVGALIATTGNIDVNSFISSGSALITGATGSVTNQGAITAQGAGLVALVAPSVVNQGSILATGGTIALAGSTAATLSLNGGLYEFAIPTGATGSSVANAVGASLNGATIRIGVGDAANLVSGVINLEGIQQASNQIVVNANTVNLKSALQAPDVGGDSGTVNASGNARLQDAVNITKTGGTVKVAAGTYTQSSTLKINKSLVLSGVGQGATLIDARTVVNNYGIQVTGDNVTLRDFTLYGPSANVAAAYGIKVAPPGGMSSRLHDFSISNVTIRGSGRAELDLNGVVGAVIDHVTADGAPVGNDTGTTAGAGIQITDSANVTVNNSATRNNLWGGLALYQANIYYNQQVNNITVAANNHFTELNPVYLQDQSASLDFGTLGIAGFDYAVRNSSSSNSNYQYTWLQATRQNAFDFAVNTISPAQSSVQDWTGAATTQNFSVGTGNLLAGGAQAMSIGSAVGAATAGATVNVYDGTYAEQLTLNKAGLTLQGHAGAKLVVPDVAEVNGINIAANNVTVTGMEIFGPVTQAYTAYDWSSVVFGNNRTRGIAAGAGVNGFNINNNNIYNVRNGILIDGRNTGSVTGNRIENTKSAISVQYTDGSSIAISGNTQGAIGNEWGLNLHLNGYWDGTTIRSNPISAAPTLAWQQALLANSAANSGWSVQDQGYTSSNRTQVSVKPGGLSLNQGSLLAPLNTVQAGVDAVVTGGVVDVAGGTYVQGTTLRIDKSLTLAGAGQAATTLDARTVSGYGINVTADNVFLHDFTLYGPTVNAASSYGIKVAPQGDANARLRDFSINNVTIRGSGRAELELNGVLGAVIDHVTADGSPVGNAAGTTKGAGIQLTDSANVTIRNSVTRQNDWGGLALYQSNRFYNQQMNNITVDAGNSFGERNPVFMQDESASHDFGTLTIAGYDYAVRNSGSTNGNYQYTWLQATQQNALDFAVNVGGSASSYVQGWNGSGATQDFQVGFGNLLGGGTQALRINTALNNAASDANIRVAAGTYAENVVVNNPYNLYFSGSTVQGLTLNSGAAGTGLSGAVTASGAGGILFDARVSLLGDTTLATLGADITLNGDIQNASGVDRALRLSAGTGSNRGDVHMLSGGTELNPLGRFDVSSSKFTLLSTLWVKGYGIDALGNVALSNHTLRAQDVGATNTLNSGGAITGATISRGSVQITSSGDMAANITASDVAVTAGGNVSGSTISQGNVQISSTGNIQGSISGSTVVVQAQGDVNVVVTASSSASVAGDSVIASVTAPVVVVAAVSDAQVSGSSSQITVNAPSGSVSGSFGQVTNSGSGLINVNGKPQGSQALSSNAENNRVVPQGNNFGDNAVAEGDGRGVTAAMAGAPAGEGLAARRVGTVDVAGEAMESGEPMELDLSPRNERRKN